MHFLFLQTVAELVSFSDFVLKIKIKVNGWRLLKQMLVDPWIVLLPSNQSVKLVSMQ